MYNNLMIPGLFKSICHFWQKDRFLCVVLIGNFIYTVFFTTISFLRYNAFSYSDFDSAVYIHECWKILHGSTLISIFCNTSILGNALELISFLIAPLYGFFFCNPKFLLFL